MPSSYPNLCEDYLGHSSTEVLRALGAQPPQGALQFDSGTPSENNHGAKVQNKTHNGNANSSLTAFAI